MIKLIFDTFRPGGKRRFAYTFFKAVRTEGT